MTKYLIIVSCEEHGLLNPDDYELKTEVQRGRKSEHDSQTIQATCKRCYYGSCNITFEEVDYE